MEKLNRFKQDIIQISNQVSFRLLFYYPTMWHSTNKKRPSDLPEQNPQDYKVFSTKNEYRYNPQDIKNGKNR